MSIKHEPTIERYEQLRADLLTAIAYQREFAESLPETTDGLHYGHMGPLENLRERHCLRRHVFEGVGWDKRRRTDWCVPRACQDSPRK